MAFDIEPLEATFGPVITGLKPAKIDDDTFEPPDESRLDDAPYGEAKTRITGGRKATVVRFANSGVVCIERDEAGQWGLAWMFVPTLIQAGDS